MGTQCVLKTFEKVIVVMLCKGRRGRGAGKPLRDLDLHSDPSPWALPYTKASPQALGKFGGGRRANGREACRWRARQDH
jgi:hypothetical protein